MRLSVDHLDVPAVWCRSLAVLKTLGVHARLEARHEKTTRRRWARTPYPTPLFSFLRFRCSGCAQFTSEISYENKSSPLSNHTWSNSFGHPAGSVGI
jgi:hypothetical protein